MYVCTILKIYKKKRYFPAQSWLYLLLHLNLALQHLIRIKINIEKGVIDWILIVVLDSVVSTLVVGFVSGSCLSQKEFCVRNNCFGY